MSQLITLDLNVNEKAIENKITNLLDSTTMMQLHTLLAKECDPYVPFLEGPLSQTLNITPDYVAYTQPYARYQYYGEHFNHTIDYHPKATAFWDKVMMSERGEAFIKQAEEILRRRAKELYG